MGAYISCGKSKPRKQLKVLLLGSTDSGKSMVLRQMRRVHGDPFAPHEVELYRQHIFLNLTQGMKCVIDAMEDMGLEMSSESRDLRSILNDVKETQDNEPYPVEYRDVLKRLWEDPSVQNAYARRNDSVALPDYLAYFYADLDRLFEQSYAPTEEDIVHCHAPMTGVTDTRFSLRKHNVIVIDAGDPKSLEEKKWAHCFETVTCVLFVVNLSGYDQCLLDDKSTNQMMDALTTWGSMCQSQSSQRTSMILIFNMNDLFEKKVQASHIEDYFPDYDGAKCDARAGREYFKKAFARSALQQIHAKEREVYIHVTSAADSALVRVVMAALEDIITSQGL